MLLLCMEIFLLFAFLEDVLLVLIAVVSSEREHGEGWASGCLARGTGRLRNPGTARPA